MEDDATIRVGGISISLEGRAIHYRNEIRDALDPSHHETLDGLIAKVYRDGQLAGYKAHADGKAIGQCDTM